MLKIQFKDKRQEPFWVVEKSLSIGKSESCHLVVNDPSVSENHAKIFMKGDAYLIKDLGSEHGTFVNGQRINQKNVACGDTITIGKVVLEIIDPIAEQGDSAHRYWSLIADSSWLSGQEFPIIGQPNDIISIGRGTQCDIVFPGTHLSRRHAEITLSSTYLTIRDLGSANGTFVNDERVELSKVYAGDRVRLDVYSFRLFGPGIQLPRSATSTHQAITGDAASLNAEDTKRWKSKPTSPGNREEINLYQRQNTQVVLASMVLLGLLGAVAYIVLAILGSN